MPTKVSYTKAVNKILALGNVLKRPLRDVLDSGGRVMATQMARTAVPFGTGASAKASGEHATSRDIAKVYATAGSAWKDINPSRKAAFWKAYKNGDMDRAEAILNVYGENLRGVRMERFDGGAAHKQARNSTTGRVRQSRPSMIVTNPKQLAKYVEEELRHVGTAKGGFADIARAIGGNPRGLRQENDITANWITRRARGYGKAFSSGTDQHPILNLKNSIAYADQTLSGTARSEAIRIAHERMIANLRIAVKHETSRVRTAS